MIAAERPAAVETKVELSNVEVWRGASCLLRRLNLAVPARKTIALIGSSGSGKTVLLRTINRLHDGDPTLRTRGSVKVDGTETLAARIDTAALRRRVGMVFPEPTPLPGSVFDNVAFGLRAMGMRDRGALLESVRNALTRALLLDSIGRSLEAPAAGMPPEVQQRVCIARALALAPEVLLLDDVTSALDPAGAAAVENVISRLRRELTIVMATNDLQQAARLSDVACYLDEGEIVEVGDTPALFSRPADVRTHAFLAGRQL